MSVNVCCDERLRVSIGAVIDGALHVARELSAACDWPAVSVSVRRQSRRTIYECAAIAETLHEYHRECHRRGAVALVHTPDVVDGALIALRRLIDGVGGSSVRISKRGHVRVDVVDDIRRSVDGDDADSASVRIIAHIRTVYRQKFGCARQGALVPAARGLIMLKREFAPECVRGLSSYSHVWLIFLFHANTHADVNATVRPPRLDGERIGTFATRSPHRPTAIGLTAVKLDSISRTQIHVSGVDLLDGTPILDIKPYHTADVLSDIRVPDWVRAENPLTVLMTKVARAEIEASMSASAFYTDAADVLALIRQSISADPRSFHSRTVDERTADETLPLHECPLYAIALDHVHVTWAMRRQTAIVLRVALATADAARTIRTAEWNAQIRRELKEQGEVDMIEAL